MHSKRRHHRKSPLPNLPPQWGDGKGLFFTFHFPLGEFEMVTYFPLKERAEPLLGGEEGGVLLLGYPKEEVGVVASATGFKEDTVAGVVIERRGAREDP